MDDINKLKARTGDTLGLGTEPAIFRNLLDGVSNIITHSDDEYVKVFSVCNFNIK